MPDALVRRIAVGDEVRVHYHPPGLSRSFAEGVVSRVDVSTRRGRVFVIDVTCDVIHDREQPISPGYQNYVLYECPEEFPGRIEVLSSSEQDPEPAIATAAPPIPEQIPVERQGTRRPTNVIRALFGRRR